MDEPQPKVTTDLIMAVNNADASPSPATAAANKLLIAEEEKTATTSSSAKKDKSSSSEEDANDVSDDAASDITDGAIAEQEALAFDVDINAAPMHLHALSHMKDARLRGSSIGSGRIIPRHNSDGKLSSGGVGGAEGGGGGAGAGRRSRSTSRSRGGHASSHTSGRRSANSSRSSSPLGRPHHNDNQDASTLSAGTAPSSSHLKNVDSNMSYSSLDGIFDPDVLLDRLGFIDLDPPLPHEIRCGPLAAPGTIDGKSNNSGGLTPVNERLSEETLEDCHAFNDLVMIDNLRQHISHSSGGGGGGGMSSTLSMPSIAHSSLSGMRSDMSVGSLSVGSFKGGHSRGGSVAGGSLLGDGENSVQLGTLDEEGEDAIEEE
ncbi:hypothetical protein ACHAXR_001584 [Thalassiosira sp. AJA248-18]